MRRRDADIYKNQLTVMCTAINQYPVSKPMNGKQAGHFLQNGAIYKVFQGLCAFLVSDHGRMDGRTHTAIKLHTCGSCIKQFIY